MKTLIYLALCFFATITYSCSSYEEEDITPINNELKIKELQSFAKECGYNNLTVDISRPLTDEDIQLYRSFLVDNKQLTRGNIQIEMYITEIYHKGSMHTLRFDYSRDDVTGEIHEAYGGVYGRSKVNYGYDEYREMYTLYSKPEFLGNNKFDIIIRAYYYVSRNYPYNESDVFDRHSYRLVIAAGLNVKTQTPTYQIHEQGEGEWEPEV